MTDLRRATFVVAFLVGTVSPLYSQEGLFKLSLEDLLNVNVKISTALKSTSTPEEAPAAVFVLTRDDLDNLGVWTLGEALNYVPGFTVGKSIQSGQQKNIYVRGEFGSLSEGILLLYNGQRLNDGITGGPMAFRPDIPLDNIRQIEVVRGPSSALYGANAFVAVVNLIPYRGSEVRSSGVSAQAGTHDLANIRASHHVTIGRRVSAVLFGSFHQLDEELRQNDVYQNLYDSLAARFVPRSWTDRYNREQFRLHTLGTSVSLGSLEIESAYQYSSAANHWGMGSVERSAPLENRHRYSSFRVGARGSTPVFSRHRLHVMGSYVQHRAENVFKVENFRSNFAEGFDPPGRASIFESELGTSSFNAEGFVELIWSPRHVTVSGVNLQADVINNVDNSTSLLDVNGDGIYDAVATDDTLDTHLGRDTRQISAAFFQHTWTPWKWITLTGGARLDHYSDVGNSLNPRLGFVVRPADRWRVKGMYGRAFRAPSFFERVQSDFTALTGRLIENSSLRPETIETYEIQVTFSPTDVLSFSVNGFYNDVQNAIQQVSIEQPGIPTQTGWENSVSRDWKGFEIGLRWSPAPPLSILGNYSYTQTTDERTADIESPVAGIPSHALNLALWGKWRRFLLGMSMISRFGWNDVPPLTTPVLENPRIDLPSYTLLQARLVVREVWNSLSLTLDGSNLLNHRVLFNDGGSVVPQGIPGNARRFTVGLNYMF